MRLHSLRMNLQDWRKAPQAAILAMFGGKVRASVNFDTNEVTFTKA